MLLRCWWWRPVLSAHRELQRPAWSKLHQGALWLVHTSADTDTVAAHHQLILLPFVFTTYLIKSSFSSFRLSYRPSAVLNAELTAGKKKRETGDGERTENIALSVSRAVIISAEHAEMKILFQAKLYLCPHHLGPLWFSGSNSVKWHQAHTTAYRSHFASVQDQLLLYCVFESWWMFNQHTVNEVQGTEAGHVV